jgi:uncharacterized protein YyaL (SSP411 family)
MLYDQAQLVLAYLEAAQATGDDFYATVAEDTLGYVLGDMTDPDGGFYSAEDADSIPPEQASDDRAHKSEGAFYIWSDAEVGELLGADAEIARHRFGIKAAGNAPQDPQGEFTGKNLLYASASLDEVAARTGRSVDEVGEALGRIRTRLLAARASRPRPHLDDKILTAWNGLMIAACARAARVLAGRSSADRYLEAARRAAAFIRTTLWREADARLLRRYRDGEAAIDAYAEDYAYLIWGLLELFQADGDVAWLEWALRLQLRQDEQFWDDADGGWFSTTGQDPRLLLRLKEDYDGAEPAASSVAAINALTVAHLTADAGALDRVERTLKRYGPRIGQAARTLPMMLCALSGWYAGYSQIVIVGPPAEADTRALQAEIAHHYLPFGVMLPLAGSQQPQSARLLPFTATMTMRDGLATAYVCRDFACRQPITAVADLHAELSQPS